MIGKTNAISGVSAPVPKIKTVSGSVISISDALAMPAVSLVVGIEPIQSGSGEPSPDNIRPISGHSEVSAYHGKVSILDGVTMHTGYFNDSGNPTESANTMRTEDYIPVTAGEKIAIRFATTNTGNRLRVHEYDSSKTWLRQSKSQVIPGMDMRTDVLTISNDASFIRFSLPNYSSLDAFNDVGTYTIQLGQTVYGGSLDVVSGVMTVTHKSFALDSVTFSWSSTYSAFYYQGDEISDLDTKVDSILACSCYKAEGIAVSSLLDYSIAGYYHSAGTTHRIYLKDSRAEGNAATLKTLLDGQICIYRLATPIAYQLTPTEIQLLLGNNVLWADSGDSELQYWARR